MVNYEVGEGEVVVAEAKIGDGEFMVVEAKLGDDEVVVVEAEVPVGSTEAGVMVLVAGLSDGGEERANRCRQLRAEAVVAATPATRGG